MRHSRTTRSLLLLAAALLSSPAPCQQQVAGRFTVSRQAGLPEESLAGRLLVLLTKDGSSEPRFQVRDGIDCAQVVGIDVDGWRSKDRKVLDSDAFGFPCASLRAVPAGDYYVQAVLNRYETFTRSDGHTVQLPPDRGEGQQWQKKPGNLYSRPERIAFDPARGTRIDLMLDQVMPDIVKPVDTDYIKHVTIKSELLSEFWGRRIELGACVLLPHGFAEHPEARYPLIVNHGHFPATFAGFRPEPPDPDLEPDYSERFQMAGYNKVQQEFAHDFFKTWTGPMMPRFVVIKVQHANPFYDDSYAVNSANLGPYGDAIMYELLPEIERRFRCIGQGWARFTYGGSTGGWEALAVQTFYPDEFNGCFAACPDPIDFRAYTVVNLYQDENAYYQEGTFARVPRPGKRDRLGHVGVTLEQSNHLELALGSRSRSGQQWDIWEAVYSPCGADGYPRRIWDKRTGVIDRQVAAYWREHYDLRHILERDWATLGPKLVGKIHLYCGTMDNFYLNNAVYLMEDFLRATKNPHFAGVIEYGDRAEHCWNGDHERSNAISRLRYHLMYVDTMVKRMQATAPTGADLTSWRY